MPATRPMPARLLPARHQPLRRRSAPSRRWGKALGVALLSGAVAAPGVGASPTSGRVPVVQPTGVVPSSAVSARISATKAPTAKAPASDVRTPSVTSVALGGVSRKVLAAAPEPGAHADEQIGALAVKFPVKPAAAASVRMKKSALVAVTADAAFAAGTAVQVRVKEKSGWSRWSTLEVDSEHGADPGSKEAEGARPGSDPLLTVAATQAQVRIDTPSGKLPKGTELTLVHASSAKSDKRGAVSSSALVSGQATVGQPPIVTRAQWGANEAMRNRAPIYTSTVRAGFIHHTASSSSYTPAQAAAQVRAIYAYHTKSLRHSDIDYNFLVDRFGQLYEGRAGGMDQPVLGGHTAGFNENTFAVSALGNFDTFAPAEADMAAMKDSIARLFAWKLGLSGVNPASTASLLSAGYIKATRYPKGSTASIPATSTHQTVNFTKCPGKHLEAQVASIRAMAGAYSDVVISAPSPAGVSFASGERAEVTLTSEAYRPVAWTADILSPCSDTPVRSYTGTSPAGQIAVTWDLKDSAGVPVLPATYTMRMTGTTTDGSGMPVVAVSTDLTITPAPGGAWGPCGNATRVSGPTPSATSVLWGRIASPTSTTVVLTGQADAGTAALSAASAAAPLARKLGAPLLVSPAGDLAPEVAAEIQARAATEVVVVGGPGVVSDQAAARVAALNVPVTRLAGSTDAATAVAVAARMGPAESAVLVSPSGSPGHALAGAALAAARGVPVLVADATTVPPETVTALAGRPYTIAAATTLPDAALPAGSVGRLTGADSVAASLAIGAAFGPTSSIMVFPEAPAGWATAGVAASAAVPLTFTPSPVLSADLAAFISGRPDLGATTTTVPAAYLSDQVLGATSRVLLGLPWAPPGVSTATPIGPAMTATRKVAATNASPEPVRKGRMVKVSAKVKAKFSDKKYRAVPAGVPFAVQFKASGAKKYKLVHSGLTTAGRATAKVKVTKSGRYRVVVGAKKAASDYVRVKR